MFDENELANSKFKELCNQNIASNVHWLKSELGTLIWYQSRGSISNLVKYREIDKNAKTSRKSLQEKQYLQEHESKLVVIADTAGMGKSIVLTSLSQQMKKDNPNLWIIRINLNNYTTVFAHELEKIKSNKPSFSNQDVNSVVNFLLNTLLESQEQSKLTTKLEKELFKSRVNDKGGIALLFDGFDEVSPDYKDIVIDILQALKKSKVEKLFITTRPTMRGFLEEKLEVFSHVLEPFDNQSQIKFLTKFWTKKLELKDLDQEHKEPLNTYAKSLIEKFSTSINDRAQEFTSIPLQMMMLAEIFQENTEGIQQEWQGCKEFLSADNTHKNPKLSERFNVLDLYEKFIAKKFYKCYLEGKNGRNLNKTGEKGLADENYKNFQEKHERLALSELFINEDLKKLLSDTELQELDEMIKTQDKIGIIDQVINNKPQFIHCTFAEYFAANFLVRSLQNNNLDSHMQFLLTDIFLKAEYDGIRVMIDDALKRLGSKIVVLEKTYTTEISTLYSKKLLNNTEVLTPVHIAALEGNIQILKFLYDHIDKLIFYSLMQQGHHGNTPLLLAAVHGHWDIVKWLIENCRASVNSSNDYGNTPLHFAAEYHEVEMVKFLIDQEAQNTSYDLMIFEPAAYCDLEIIQWLVNDKQVDIDKTDSFNRNIITFAAEHKYWGIVEWLIIPKSKKGGGAKVDVVDKYNRSVLTFAAVNNKDTIIKMLESSKNMFPQKNKNQALRLAAVHGHWDIVKSLIQDWDADVDSKGYYSNTPLHYAAEYGHWDIVKSLIQGWGADVNHLNSDGDTPLHFAAEYHEVEMVKFLIDQEAQNTSYDLMIFKPAAYCDLEIIQWLVNDKQVDIDKTDSFNRNIITFAAEYGHWDIVKWLITPKSNGGGAAVNIIDQYNRSVLTFAAANNKDTIIKMLESSKNMFPQENKNQALRLAAAHGYWDIVKSLIQDWDADADVDSKGYYGNTQTSMAEFYDTDIIGYCPTMSTAVEK